MAKEKRPQSGRNFRARPSTAEQRRAQMSKIHIGKQQLQMADDVYRDMLSLVAGVRSSRELDDEGLYKVIRHLVSLGADFRFGHGKRTRPAIDKAPLLSKVKALLADGQYPDTYGDQMARHMFGVERWEWLTNPQLSKLVAALAIHKQRKRQRED